MVYARQENEEVFNPLHISPPSVQGLIRAISAKYQAGEQHCFGKRQINQFGIIIFSTLLEQIDSVDIRFAFRETRRGIVVKIDDDMVRYYCNGDAFIMKVKQIN